jgi:N-acetylglutamate synthase-like GNAT family acetyltransferase
MQDILIRKANESDLPAIRELLDDLIGALDNTEGIDIEIALRICSHLMHDASSHFLVADMNATAVGLINFTIRRTVLHRSPSALINELVVARDYRRKGVGRQLVLAAIQRCKALGCCEVEVSTEKTNVKARDFYRQCGFEEKGILLEADL